MNDEKHIATIRHWLAFTPSPEAYVRILTSLEKIEEEISEEWIQLKDDIYYVSYMVPNPRIVEGQIQMFQQKGLDYYFKFLGVVLMPRGSSPLYVFERIGHLVATEVIKKEETPTQRPSRFYGYEGWHNAGVEHEES